MTSNTYGLQLAELAPLTLDRFVDIIYTINATDAVDAVAEVEPAQEVDPPPLTPFEQVPNELWYQVFECLDLREKIEAAKICRRFREILQSPAAWHTLDLRSVDGSSRYNTAIAQVIRRCPNAIKHVYLHRASPINDHGGAELLRSLLRANSASLETFTARVPLTGLSLALSLPALTNLRKLELLGATNILRVKNYLFDVLRFPPSLEELTIRAVSLPPLGHPHPLPRFAGRLRVLDLEVINQPNVLRLEVLAPFRNTLEELRLTGCALRREPIRQHLFHQFTRLRGVWLSECTVDMHGHLPGGVQTLELYDCLVATATRDEWLQSNVSTLSSFSCLYTVGLTWQNVADLLTDNHVDVHNRPTRLLPQHLHTLKIYWPINNPPQTHMQFSLEDLQRILVLHGGGLETVSFVDQDITEEVIADLLTHTKPAHLRLGSMAFAANSIQGLIHEMRNTLKSV